MNLEKELNLKLAEKSFEKGSAFCQIPCWGLSNLPSGAGKSKFVFRTTIKPDVTAAEMIKETILIKSKIFAVKY